MPRWVNARDANHSQITKALTVAGVDFIQLFDCDIAARHANGFGMLLEVKVPGKEKQLKPKQIDLRRIFGDRFAIVSSPESALRALGKI